MNRENIQRLRDHLAGLNPAKFNLRYWFSQGGNLHRPTESDTYGAFVDHSCGTAACIAGHAAALFLPEQLANPVPRGDLDEVLGLNEKQLYDLFEPAVAHDQHSSGRRYLPYGRSMESVTTSEAVKVLEHLLETGVVDWRVIQ